MGSFNLHLVFVLSTHHSSCLTIHENKAVERYFFPVEALCFSFPCEAVLNDGVMICEIETDLKSVAS